jgi:hypothetical protein
VRPGGKHNAICFEYIGLLFRKEMESGGMSPVKVHPDARHFLTDTCVAHTSVPLDPARCQAIHQLNRHIDNARFGRESTDESYQRDIQTMVKVKVDAWIKLGCKSLRLRPQLEEAPADGYSCVTHQITRTTHGR